MPSTDPIRPAAIAAITWSQELAGCLVVEVIVPQLRRVPRGAIGRIFTLEPDHVGIGIFDDLVGQVAWSHHWIEVDGRLVKDAAPCRYV